MGFNNGLERKKFEARWSRLRVEYAANGMEESMITEMYEFDLQEFNSNRRYAEHTQAISQQIFSDDGDEAGEDKSALLMKFLDTFTAGTCDTYQLEGKGWVDEIENERLWKGISQLSDSDKELLTLHIFHGYSITEIAQMQGVARPTVSKKLTRIKKFLQKYVLRATKCPFSSATP